jgi:hypothetical protein
MSMQPPGSRALSWVPQRSMKIIIAGSRDISNYEVVRQAVIASGYWKEFGRNIEVVCGMAVHWKWREDPTAGGVDRWGFEFAKRNGLVIHEFPADWKQYGGRAGMIRNIEMGEFAKAHGGRLLAVWDGESTGTMHMVRWAQQNGLQHVLFKRVTDELYRKVGRDEVAMSL